MPSDYYFLIYTPINIILFKVYPDINRLLFYCTLSCISIYDILFYNENYNINTNLLEYNYCGDLISKLSLQYFITDSLFNNISKDIKIHHIVALTGVSINLYYNIGYNIFPYLGLGEISSIFLISKKIVSKKYYNLHNNLFMITFLSSRILLLPILLYNYYFYSFPSKYYLIPTIPLLFDNLLHGFWCIKFIKKNK